MDKKNLKKLFEFIVEISQLKGNEWFKKDVIKKLSKGEDFELSKSHLDDIYELCIRKIIKEHATNFYSDFKLLTIKQKLIEDFIRMEKFRREGNFEDFCLAAYQQLESIVGELISTTNFSDYFRSNKDSLAILKYDYATNTYIRRGNQTVGGLTFQTGDQAKINNYLNGSIQGWFFTHKFRAVLYFYYFNTKIETNTVFFDRVYEIGNFLYQGRNLNHRGAVQTPYQQKIIDDLIPNQHKYYLKFLGFLEDFITAINKNL